MRSVVLSLFIVTGLFAASGAAAQDANAPAGTMVFFDFGKSEIQRDYLAPLNAAATAVLSQPGTSVIVDGHSDRPGSRSSNRQASLRRAEAVRDYLVARGVAAQAITVTASGEDRPLIATADGVREPQNRRVDVRIVAQQKR